MAEKSYILLPNHFEHIPFVAPVPNMDESNARPQSPITFGPRDYLTTKSIHQAFSFQISPLAVAHRGDVQHEAVKETQPHMPDKTLRAHTNSSAPDKLEHRSVDLESFLADGLGA